MSLRRKVIRLAYTKPHLQKVLLPILAEVRTATLSSAEAKKYIGKKLKGFKIEDVSKIKGEWAAYFTNADGAFVWAYLNELLDGKTKPKMKKAPQKSAKFEEGKKVDVAKWLRENGHEDAAEKWEKYEGTLGKTATLAKAALSSAEAKKYIGKKLKGFKIEDVSKIKGEWAAYFKNSEGDLVWAYLNELLDGKAKPKMKKAE